MWNVSLPLFLIWDITAVTETSKNCYLHSWNNGFLREKNENLGLVRYCCGKDDGSHLTRQTD